MYEGDVGIRVKGKENKMWTEKEAMTMSSVLRNIQKTSQR